MSWVVRENLEAIFPLSPLQEGIFFHSQLEPERSPYLGQVVWDVDGEIDAGRLDATWRHLVRRHPSLRTVFRQGRKDPVQIALKRLPCSISVVDLEALDDRRQTTELPALPEKERRFPLALAHGPLFRIWLFRLGPRRCKLMMTFNHIILDGWSLSILLADLAVVHQAVSEGREPPPAEPSGIQPFVDWLGHQDQEEALAHWRVQLKGVTAPTPLPFDRWPAPRTAGRFSARLHVISADLNRRLGAVARRHQVTRNTLLSAAWALLLARHSGEDDVVLGITVSGRPVELSGAARMVGPFINTLPLRVRTGDGRPLGELLHETQQQGVDLNHYSYVSLADVQAVVGLRPGRQLFDTVFNYQRRDATEWVLGGATLKPDLAFAGVARTNYPLLVDAYDRDELWLWISFLETVFEPTVVERVAAHYEQLLLAIAEHPDAAVGELSMLSAAERQQVVERFSSTAPAASWQGSVPDVFAERVRQAPDAVAVVCGAEAISFAELSLRSSQVSRRLAKRGVTLESRIGVFGERCPEMLVAILGVLATGAAYVPLDSESPDRRLEAIVVAARLDFVVGGPGHTARLTGLVPSGVGVLDWKALQDPPAGGDAHGGPDRVRPVDPSSLAYIFFTSGSTGVPKGAMVHHAGMMNHLWAKVEFVSMSRETVLAQTASHCFDISVWQFFAPLAVGGVVHVYPNEISLDPERLATRITRDRVTVLETVPSFIDALLESVEESANDPPALGGLDLVLSTGEALPAPLRSRWLRRWPETPLTNVYGPTECSDDITHERFDEPVSPALVHLPIGRPIPGMRLFLLNRHLEPVPVGVRGQITASGVGVGRGYLGDPARTAAVYVPHPLADGHGDRLYLTGDVGRWAESGAIEFLGRLDLQVKIRGNRIELREVEGALQSLPGVGQAVVVARAEEPGGKRLVAYWVGDGTIGQDRLRAGLAELLPRYMVPDQLVHLPELPTTRAGKVDRRALPAPPPPSTGRTSRARPPRNPLEAQIVEVWQEVLGVEAIGIDDDFFELGGQSLKTVRVRARLERELGVDVPLRVVFDHSTVADQAKALEALSPDRQDSGEGIPRVEERAAYPLSHAQRRLWFLAQASPEDTFYNLSMTPVLRGALDLRALFRAIRGLVERHESLRTGFVLADGEPMQVIEPRPDVGLPVCDLSGLPEAAARRALATSLDGVLRRPFDLARRLVAFSLYRLSPECHLLALRIHHIVTDGRSGEVILHDLEHLYLAECEGRASSLPPLPIRYVDYAVWHNEWLSRHEAEVDRAYWLDRLQGGVVSLKLPFDHRGLDGGDGGTWACEVRLSAPEADGVRDLSVRRRATRFMSQLALLEAFLARLSGEDDLVIGVPVSGRSHIATENLVGFFVNTIVLRTSVPPGATLEELTSRVAEAARGAFAHGEFPFDLLVRHLNPARDLGQTPLIPVFFSHAEAAPPASAGRPFAEAASVLGVGSPWDGADHLPGVALSVSAMEETGGSLRWSLLWSRARFDRSTAARFTRSLEALIRSGIARPDAPVGSLDLLPRADRHQVLREWSASPVSDWTEESLPQIFRRQVAAHPEAVAVTSSQETLTYGELGRRCERLAARLRAAGAGPETVVGLHLERSPGLVTAMLAVLEAGAAFVPLPPSYPAGRLRFMIDDASDHGRRGLIVSRGDLARSLPSPVDEDGPTPPLLLVDDGVEGGRQEARAVPAPEAPWPDQLAYVIYTSGSTGRPKGVCVPHRGLGKLVSAMRDLMGVGRDSRCLQFASPSFDVSIFEIAVTLGSGGALVVGSDEELLPGPGLVDLLEDRRVTTAFFPPSSLSVLPQAELPLLGTILVGGEACRPELAARWSGRRRVLNAYGPTEATVWVSTATYGDDPERFPIGRPLDGFRLQVLDRSLRPLPAGVHGELCIGGIGLARGYLGRPARTAEAFVPDPFATEPGARIYHTGDLARTLPDGQLGFLGRIDHQIKLRGFRIELGEIESVLAKHPEVKDAACRVFAGSEPSDGRLVAYVVPRRSSIAVDELRRHLAERLPAYMAPSELVLLPSLPVSPSGKVDRKALPRPTGRGSDAREFVPPRDGLELEVAGLWATELELTAVDVQQDFFEAGGHSLKVISFLSRLEERFGVRMPIRAFFEAPTVARVAGWLEDAERSTAPPSVPAPGLIRLAEGPASEAPLFLIHPHGGTVFCFHPLARELEGERSVFGIQAPGLEPDSEPCDDLVQMASGYRDAFRRVQPAGPVHLAGWSFGGPVAFEVARQMEAGGETIGSLTILDSPGPVPTAVQQAPDLSVAAMAKGFLDIPREAFDGLDEDAAMERFRIEARRLGRLPEGIRAEGVRRLAEVIRANTVAFARYRPSGALSADLCLVVARDGSHVTGSGEWHRWTSGRVEVAEVPGDHDSLVEPPAVSEVARVLRRRIEGAVRPRSREQLAVEAEE